MKVLVHPQSRVLNKCASTHWANDDSFDPCRVYSGLEEKRWEGLALCFLMADVYSNATCLIVQAAACATRFCPVLSLPGISCACDRCELRFDQKSLETVGDQEKTRSSKTFGLGPCCTTEEASRGTHIWLRVDTSCLHSPMHISYHQNLADPFILLLNLLCKVIHKWASPWEKGVMSFFQKMTFSAFLRGHL